MNIKDEQFVLRLISAGEQTGELCFVPIFREGLLLLALPSDRRLAMATVNLYQPQKWKGRFFKCLLKLAVWTGAYSLISKQSVPIGGKGLIALLEKKTGARTLGFLLGSPESATRNLIGVITGEESYSVVKAGFGAGSAVLQAEYAMTEEFGLYTEGMPECLWGKSFYDGFAYLAERIEGDSPRGEGDAAKVFGLLSRWLESGESRQLSGLSSWQKLRGSVLGNERALRMVDDLGVLAVLAPVMHGDFAPWNIKITANGEVKVLDWEFAVRHGVPGWDGIHYQVQKMSLVEGRECSYIYECCVQWLSGEMMQPYMSRSGLVGHEEELFVAYCYYSGLVLGYSRADLINICEERKYEKAQ